MIVIGDAPLRRGCALACAPCSSAGPAAASAAAVRRTLRRSISLSSAVGGLTICPSIAHRSHALWSLKIEAWLWPPVKETGPRRCRRAIMLAPTDGTASGHEGCKKPKGGDARQCQDHRAVPFSACDRAKRRLRTFGAPGAEA